MQLYGKHLFCQDGSFRVGGHLFGMPKSIPFLDSNNAIVYDWTMEQLVLDYFKKIIAQGFPNLGRLENPTVRVDSKTENINICETGDRDQLYLDLKTDGATVEEIKYQCDLCDPTGFVTAEILCELVKGKEVTALENCTYVDFTGVLGGESEQLERHVKGVLELLRAATRKVH